MSVEHERAFEDEICDHLAAYGWLYSPTGAGYDKARALFPADVFAWLAETQPEEWAKVVKPSMSAAEQEQAREQLLDRLVKTLDLPLEAGGGTLAVLRKGFKKTPARFAMCEFKPATTLNAAAMERYAAVRVRVMRQVYYSGEHKGSIDLVLFVNGLSVATNSSTHEPVYGADLGVILDIDLPNMSATVGHLVQVKQAANRDAPTEAPKWSIPGDQLDDILRHDATATYWLFAQHRRPPVLSVPAKLLRARLGGNKSVTIQYDHIRSAAVPVEQELVDFVLGLWVGSDSSEAVKIASGEDSRHTPRRVLTLRLRQGG